ncbi:MAG: RNA polymerase sigma factor [Planctomycetaceae bacterium]|jgi:RNA polymerase sigma factor (sigma-70 family)|nr:RNA polymerase sigma factor [Planctomycetaceae bacterium]
MSEPAQKNSEQDNIVSRYYGRVAAFVHRRVRSREDGEDILQNVFYRLARTDQLALPVDNALPWLFRVARNLITDFWRKRKGLLFSDTEDDLEEIVSVLLAEETERPEDVYLQRIFWEKFRSVLAELPSEQREVFELTEFQGQSYREISERSGVNVNTLLSRKRYAVQHLRKHLQEMREMILGE